MRRRDRRQREDGLSGLTKSTLSAGLLGLALSLVPPPGRAVAQAQGASTGAEASRPWLDPALLAAARAEGSLIVYSSTNEQEGLPLFKLFTDATGIKVEYVRASDAILMSRMSIEFRADQKSYDIVQTATINKMPLQMLAAYEPPGGRQHLRRMPAIRTSAGMASTPTTMRRPTTPGRSRPRSCRRATRSLPSTRNGPARSPSTAPTTNGSRPSCSITASRRASSW
mgnify:CR=1 FL=1